MDFAKIEKLMELMRKHGMQELSVADESQEISIKAPSFAAPLGAALGAHMPAHAMSVPFAAPMQAAAQPASAAHAAGEAHVKPATASGKMIKSPFVGTFYRSSQPGAQAFVSVGQRIKKGDVLCIVEAMKLMNEIESEVDGVVREILVDNEQPVEFDQPLFIVE
ncbi:MAG: hypothetical protein RIQ81_2571 [Pseudomonadota bacterium]|jgi:acetyl-CoA carboxylase biotin carboxyl carrier protein